MAGKYETECDEKCTHTFGFRVILLWCYWSLLFLGLALRASYVEVQKRRRKRAFESAPANIGMSAVSSSAEPMAEYAMGEGVELDI